MLGGAHNEVVPHLQMQELWAIIRNCRHNSANKKKPPVEPVKEDEEDKDEKEKWKEGIWLGSLRSRPRPMSTTGSRSGLDNHKVPLEIVVDGGNIYIKFLDGMHSEFLLKSLVAFFLLTTPV